MDSKFLNKKPKKVQLRMKSHLDKLDSPSESVEFMEHMLEQTKTVNNLRKAVKKTGLFATIAAGSLLVYSFASFYFSLYKD